MASEIHYYRQMPRPGFVGEVEAKFAVRLRPLRQVGHQRNRRNVNWNRRRSRAMRANRLRPSLGRSKKGGGRSPPWPIAGCPPSFGLNHRNPKESVSNALTPLPSEEIAYPSTSLQWRSGISEGPGVTESLANYTRMLKP